RGDQTYQQSSSHAASSLLCAKKGYRPGTANGGGNRSGPARSRSLGRGRGPRSAFEVTAGFGLAGLDREDASDDAVCLRRRDLGLRRERAAVESSARSAGHRAVLAVGIAIA